MATSRGYVDRILGIFVGLIVDSFVQARHCFEQGVTTVMTVRDFTQIFDSYTKFAEYVIGTLMAVAAARREMGIVSDDGDFDFDIALSIKQELTVKFELFRSIG